MIQNIDSVKVNFFLKNLALAKKKIEQRKEAKEKLSKQFKKVRNIPLPKTKRPILDKELKELEIKINEVIDAERKIFTQQKQEYFFSKELERRINALEGKIDEFLAYRKERQRKVQEIEEKIKKKTMTRTERKYFLKQQIAKLENKLNLLKQSKKYDQSSLDIIKSKIDFLKKKIINP